MFSSLKYFLKEESLFCNFCTITGLLSISKSKYEPPCKSKPKLIFFSIKLSSNFKKLDVVKYTKKIVNIAIEIILILEKYNTEN